MEISLLSIKFLVVATYFAIVIGLFLVSVLGIVEIGSVQEILNRIPESFATLWSTSGDPTQNGMMITWAGIVLGLGFVLSFGYWTTDFLVVQRAFSAKDLRSARLTLMAGAHPALWWGLVMIVFGGIFILREPKAKEPHSGAMEMQRGRPTGPPSFFLEADTCNGVLTSCRSSSTHPAK